MKTINLRVCTWFLWVVLAPVVAPAEPIALDDRQLLKSLDVWHVTDGNWEVNAGRLAQRSPQGVAAAFLREPAMANVDVEVQFRVRAEGSGVRTAGIILRSIDSKRGYFVHFDTRGNQLILMRGDPLSAYHDEITRVGNVGLSTDQWHKARATAVGEEIRIYLDDRRVLGVTDDRYAAGRAGLYTSQGHVEFKSLRIRGEETELEKKAWQRLPDEPPVVRDQPIATVYQTRVLCKQPGRYIGWPSITQAANGDLLAVFSGDRGGHVSEDGKTQLIRSKDGGKTWTEPTTINDLSIDDRDAGIVRTQRGTLIVSWFTGPPYHIQQQGHYVIRSGDHGYTWSDPIRTEVTTPHGPIQLQDGRLLYLGQNPHCSHAQPANFNGPPGDSPYSVSLQVSLDDGRTWEPSFAFPVPDDAPMLSFDEPHLVETQDGTIIAQFRDCNSPHQIWQSESSDGGRTWSQPWRTKLHGYPPHLIRLSNDWLLCTYAKRWPPFGQYACVSRDSGKTWDVANEIQLSHATSGDLGYPASVQLNDGSIWTVYYEIDRPGEKPCLKGTYWRLKAPPVKLGADATAPKFEVLDQAAVVKGVCAWPNLTVLPDGTNTACIFNRPSHGALPGDVDCYASTDDGRTWKKRGTVAKHEPSANRMNVAAGLAHNGDLVVLALLMSAACQKACCRDEQHHRCPEPGPC